jgi:hypothetical protein
MEKLPQEELHKVFIDALKGFLISYSDIEAKPLLLDLKAPLPQKIRLYIYNATHPPGGRTVGEHKIQLIVPGQKRGERGNFDYSDGRIVILAGYESETDVFVLWDAGMFPNFSYSRNVQVRAETIYAAFAGKIGQQSRNIRGKGQEIVITAQKEDLSTALQQRVRITTERLIGAD